MAENDEENVEYRLLPKGLILYALGGFANGESETAQKVCDELKDYLQRNGLALAVIDDKLDFIEIKTETDG